MAHREGLGRMLEPKLSALGEVPRTVVGKVQGTCPRACLRDRAAIAPNEGAGL